MVPTGVERATTVLAAVDVGPGSDTALNRGIIRTAAAVAHPSSDSLHVVHAWTVTAESMLACPVRGIGRLRIAALRRWTRAERRERIRALIEAEGAGRQVHVVVEHGRPGTVVRRVAARLEADLVVLGAVDPPPFPGFVLSPMAEALAGGREYSVLLVRSPVDDGVDLGTERAGA